jgi:lipopolysaccharide biosynthesis glycosyltransferase
LSIERLANSGYVDLPRQTSSAAKPHPSTALIFVFDSEFIKPFKVLLYSMAKLGTLVGLPIIVLTQDPAVAEDPVVKAAADDIRMLGQAEIEQFKVISGRRVPDRYKLDWIAKYTFLKWSIFDDFGYDQLLFIDADIICLNPVEDLLSSDLPGDMLGGPRFMETLLQDDAGNRLADDAIFRNLRRMIKGKFDASHTRLNSGVMLLRKRLLTKDFRDELLRFAATRDYVNEQSYLTGFFADNKDYTLTLMSSRYNFGAGALADLPLMMELQVTKDIVFLHYPGPRKPWRMEPSLLGSRFSHVLWHRAYNEAVTNTRLFGSPKRAGASRNTVTEADM